MVCVCFFKVFKLFIYLFIKIYLKFINIFLGGEFIYFFKMKLKINSSEE
jgi:hypothetical protein